MILLLEMSKKVVGGGGSGAGQTRCLMARRRIMGVRPFGL